tara:strand:- start:4388 stop:5167 length:780 start_codon:yes stop_codon:yes gene_type:complete
MVVKKSVVKKKRKVKKKKTLTQTQTQKQVVNVYLNKLNRQRRAKPTAPKQVIQRPQMYNAGIDNLNDMVMGLTRRNNTLMGIIDKQRKTDTTPNSDITSLDELVGKKKVKIDGLNVFGLEETEGFEDLNKQKNIVMDTSSRQEISDRLSSIAEGMDEIPEGGRIKNNILELGDRIRPVSISGVRQRVARIDELDEMGKLELEYDGLVKQLQEQRRYDTSIRMANYTNRLPNKVSTLKKKIADMRNTLDRSIDKMGDQAL